MKNNKYLNRLIRTNHKEEINEEKLNLLMANEETIRRKVNTAKSLEEEILNLKEDPTETENTLNL